MNLYAEKDSFKVVKFSDVEQFYNSIGHFPNNTATMITQSAMKSLARITPANRYEVFQEASLLD